MNAFGGDRTSLRNISSSFEMNQNLFCLYLVANPFFFNILTHLFNRPSTDTSTLCVSLTLSFPCTSLS